ncbi:MAG: NarK/NasA family nitrate transporter [Deltaproteobacteria bacterium]|nr:NarK/NasA family nitrate transporter [Deltaproteobacteria bacterium]
MNVKEFRRAGHWPTLFSAFLYFDVSFMVWVLLGALGVFIAQDFGLTASQKGFLVALPLLAGACLRLPMGIIADRFGPKRVGAIGLLLTTVPLLWGWLGAASLTEVYVIGVLLGVAGSSFAVALPLASRWYPPEYQGLAMGIAGAGNSGTIIAALAAPRLADYFGWHEVFGLALLPILGALAVYLLCAQESPTRPAPQQFGSYLAVLKERDLWRFNLFYMVTFGGFVGLASFLAIFLHDEYGVSRIAAGNLTALCVCAGSFVRPLGGHLADRLGGVPLLMLLFWMIGLFMLVLSQLPALPVAVLFLCVTMALLGMGNGAVFQLVPQRFRHEIGVATGLVGATGGLGGFLLPSLLGVCKDLFGFYGAGFLVFGLVALAALLSLLTIQQVWRESWAGDGTSVVLAGAER